MAARRNNDGQLGMTSAVAVKKPGALGAGWFILFLSLFNSALFQWPLYALALSTRPTFGWRTIAAVGTLFVFQMMISMTVFGLCAIVSIRLLKILSALFTVANSVALYFIVQYNVGIDATMIGNIVNTNVEEAAELFHPKLLLYILVFGFIPAIVVLRQRVVPGPLLRRAAFIAVSLLAGSAWVYANAQSWLWIDKNAKAFGGRVLPWSYLINAARYYTFEAERHRVALPLPPITSVKPGGMLFVLVIGEAARVQNFSLYGYRRATNPRLAQDGVVAYPAARSCSTYTTASLRCMLSHRGANGLSANDEPLPSYLYRHGIEVIWRTNNFGEPPLQVSRYDSAERIRKTCKQDCARLDFDDVLLHGLDAMLRGAKDDTKTLIVLHQGGSHGPQYSKKYPAEFDRFKPSCQSVDLQKCGAGELVNAYDNTIVYTDDLLHRLITLLKSLERPSVMLYMSDHGESLGENGLYLHGVPMPLAPEVQFSVPLIVWTSDKFKQSGGGMKDPARLGGNRSHDVVFHSVLGAMGLRSSVYVPENDLFQAIPASKPPTDKE
ncbi:MAG: phosphoethanolamine--lipid A transferase EptA [Pseudomonadota bacterium]